MHVEDIKLDIDIIKPKKKKFTELTEKQAKQRSIGYVSVWANS